MAALAGGAALGDVTMASLGPLAVVAVRLAPEDVEAIAQRVAELIGPRARIGLVDVDEICRRFRVSRTWVYEHARELGAIPLGQTGGGRRPRLRFDLERATCAIEQMSGEHDAAKSRNAPSRPRSNDVPAGVKLIQPRGSAA
jgi:hypothetical protein